MSRISTNWKQKRLLQLLKLKQPLMSCYLKYYFRPSFFFTSAVMSFDLGD